MTQTERPVLCVASLLSLAPQLADLHTVVQYGDVNAQLEFVAAQLADIPELQSGFDAIGLSQGSSSG